MKKVENNVLADGETTGHAHRLTKTDVFELDNGVRIFDSCGDTLVHEEHGLIELPAGEFASDKVLEYDHFLEEAKKVRD